MNIIITSNSIVLVEIQGFTSKGSAGSNLPLYQMGQRTALAVLRSPRIAKKEKKTTLQCHVCAKKIADRDKYLTTFENYKTNVVGPNPTTHIICTHKFI